MVDLELGGKKWTTDKLSTYQKFGNIQVIPLDTINKIHSMDIQPSSFKKNKLQGTQYKEMEGKPGL